MPSPSIRILLIGIALALPSIAPAQVTNLTASEMALAPPYCPDTQGYGRGNDQQPDSRQKRWVEIMGWGFWAMHHYCWAVIHVIRAEKFRVPQRERDFWYGSAIGDVNFVLRNSPRDFVMRPELNTKKGEWLAKMRKFDAAADAYREAATLKPDYWPAYTGLADMLKDKGQVDDALGVAEEGLRHAPDSRGLASRVEALRKAGAKSPGNRLVVQPPGEEAKPAESDPATDTPWRRRN